MKHQEKTNKEEANFYSWLLSNGPTDKGAVQTDYGISIEHALSLMIESEGQIIYVDGKYMALSDATEDQLKTARLKYLCDGLSSNKYYTRLVRTVDEILKDLRSQPSTNNGQDNHPHS